MSKHNYKVIRFLEVLAKRWSTNIEYGRQLNLPMGVEISDTEYEALTCLEFGIKGTGKKSGDNDHDNGDETKGASKIRSKKCDCGLTCHFFEEKCKCGSETFSYSDDNNKTDVRWGIDTDAHFRYGVPKYHCWILEAENYNSKNKVFYLKLFTIDGKNEVFNEILKVQNESNSKHKNFIPYSKDFYASGPEYVSCYKINLNDDGTVSVTTEKVEKIRITKDMLLDGRNLKKYLPNTFVPMKDTYLYEEVKQLFKVRKFKTSHGKERGKTTRRSEQNL